jgi:hypothetical protein
MREEPDIKCDMASKTYRDMAITGGFFLVLYATVPLAWFSYALTKAKTEDHLREMSTMRGYGPLYLHYTTRSPLWEVYVLFRKLLLVLVQRLLARWPGWQLVLTVGIMGVSLLLQVAAAPIQNESLGNLELVMLATSACIACVGSLSNSGDSNDDIVTALVVCILLAAVAASASILYQAIVKAVEAEDGEEPLKRMVGGHIGHTTTTTTTTTTSSGHGSHDHHAMHLNLHVPGMRANRGAKDAIVAKANARTVV